MHRNVDCLARREPRREQRCQRSYRQRNRDNETAKSSPPDALHRAILVRIGITQDHDLLGPGPFERLVCLEREVDDLLRD